MLLLQQCLPWVLSWFGRRTVPCVYDTLATLQCNSHNPVRVCTLSVVQLTHHSNPSMASGQSNYYLPNATQVPGTDPCLAGRQPDPVQPGRTDPIVNGRCPICNTSHPCLFDVLNDPTETKNVATSHVRVDATMCQLHRCCCARILAWCCASASSVVGNARDFFHTFACVHVCVCVCRPMSLHAWRHCWTHSTTITSLAT